MELRHQSYLSRCWRYVLVALVGLTSTALVLVVSGGYLDGMLTEGFSTAPSQATGVQIAGVAHGSGMDPNMPMPGMHGSSMQMSSPGGSANVVSVRRDNQPPKRS